MTGLEPAASGVTGRRSNQLSYTRSVCGAVSNSRSEGAQDLFALLGYFFGCNHAADTMARFGSRQMYPKGGVGGGEAGGHRDQRLPY